MPNLIQAVYKSIVKPCLFRFDAERVHAWAVARLKKIGQNERALGWLKKRMVVEDPALAVAIKTLRCPNPVGLAAGFDKNAELGGTLPALGFGHAELGTFTPQPQPGQEEPQLFRYARKKAIVNRMGFNNPGAAAPARAFNGAKPGIPVGINIGKGRDTPNADADDDYLAALDAVHPYADYIALNFSSPNTPGLRDLQTIPALTDILKKVVERNRQAAEKEGVPAKLVFTKISPDLEDEIIEDIARLCVELGSGIIATNTTTDHSALGKAGKEEGGLSGAPLKNRSNRVLKKIYGVTKGTIPLIGVGGIFSAEDAYEKIRLGASLVQVYTGWIYEGPTLIPSINKGLLRLMKRDGFSRIQDAVGTLH